MKNNIYPNIKFLLNESSVGVYGSSIAEFCKSLVDEILCDIENMFGVLYISGDVEIVGGSSSHIEIRAERLDKPILIHISKEIALAFSFQGISLQKAIGCVKVFGKYAVSIVGAEDYPYFMGYFLDQDRFIEYVDEISKRNILENPSDPPIVLYLVGGAVRSRYSGEGESHDEDYVITGAGEGLLTFRQLDGARFPVYQVPIIRNGSLSFSELALARIDINTGLRRNDFKTVSGKHITILQDLSRRELTVNAIAVQISGEGESTIFDPYQGIQDAKNGVLDYISAETFVQDGDRAQRVARFMARSSHWRPTDRLKVVMGSTEMRAAMKTIHPTAVFKNLSNTVSGVKDTHRVLSCRRPGRFFRVLHEAGLLNIHFPILCRLDIPDMHDGTTLNHVLRGMDQYRDFVANATEYELFGFLLHDAGKAYTDPEIHPHHYKHESRGKEGVEEFCLSFGIESLPNKMVEVAKVCASRHMWIKTVSRMKKFGKLIEFAVSYMNKRDIVGYLLNVAYVDSASREGADLCAINAEFDIIRHRVATAFKAIESVNPISIINRGITPNDDLEKFKNTLHSERVKGMIKLLQK